MALLNASKGRALALFLLGAAATLTARADAPSDELEQGRRIYQEGVLPSGAPLQGVRFGNMAISGAQAACVNCHRRSGMGSVEGGIVVSPVTGNALFQRSGNVVAAMDLVRLKTLNQKHAPYSDDTLARAIRDGISSSGQPLNTLMPHFALSDGEMKALAAYLKQLSEQWSPGVSAKSIRFATVVAPGVEPERRKALLDTLHTAFTQKNGSTLPGRRYMTTSAEMIMNTGRKWELEVWELRGAPETWGAQLDEHYRKNPVFALVSGLSNTTWEPVHAFCQKERVPCWFPSVDLPVAAEGFYPLYFSRGVALEADVLAQHLRGLGEGKPRRLVQVYRDDYVGNGAAAVLKRKLAESGIEVEDRVLRESGPGALRRLMAGVLKADTVMFWLRPGDVAALDKTPPTETAYFSAVLADAEHKPFPAAWKNRARLVYPYELPEKRQGNLEYFHAWLKSRQLPLVDEPLQAEAFFAVNSLADTVTDMLDNLYRDYLVERAESMLTQNDTGKAEQQIIARQQARWRTNMPAGKQQGTSIYPRISLGPDQRFASKGGYIVRFADAKSDKLVAESDWIVP